MRTHNTIYNTCIGNLSFYSCNLIEVITAEYCVHKSKQYNTTSSKKYKKLCNKQGRLQPGAPK